MASRHRKKKKDKAAKKARAVPHMNVTPLVDVVLVLLIIFMVVIPAMQQGVKIDYAGIANYDAKEEKKSEPWSVSITADGDLYFGEDPLPWNKAQAYLQTMAKKAPGKRIVLHGDKRASYKKIKDVYRMAQMAGFPGVSLRVNPRSANP